MEGEEYEIIPHEVLSDLKDEVHVLKERLSRPLNEEEKELILKIHSLGEEIDELKAMINSAVKSVEGDDDSSVNDIVNRLGDRISTLESQNEQIANALITLSQTNQKIMAKIDSLTIMFKQNNSQNQQPQQRNINPPQPQQFQMKKPEPQNIPEPKERETPPSLDEEIPPPPKIEDVKEKKKSIFDIFK